MFKKNDRPGNVSMMKAPTKRLRLGKNTKIPKEKEPTIDGDELTTNIEKRKPTGHSKEVRRQALQQSEMQSVIQKPKSDVEEEETQKRQKNTSSKAPPKKKNPKKTAAISHEVETAVAKFIDHVNEKGVAGLYKEYSELKTYLPAEYNFEVFSKHKDKNRFSDVVCLDNTRVVLKTDYGNYQDSDGDYIHANWVELDGLERKYIASQAPMPNTIEDFWRMAFQESVASIVVVCKFVENEQSKCTEYWPQKPGGYSNFGKMFVNNKKVEQEDKFDTYTLEILPDGCSNSHVCKLIHVTNWPDKGVPSSGRMVLRMMKMVKESGPGTCVVHCSAGIGRTGTILAIEIINTRLFKGKETTVREVFTQLRNQRASSIQTEAQYLFIYSTVLDYIKAKLPQKYSSVVAKFYADLEKL